ncbi:hypothetical protein VP01_4840g1 [Puccinia sorghi]|uniref:Uncharacterized protein n=1 Tax=Puccinia sorghi TaxID=27349 RepID=A0A0L6UME8_9BASI|nr:hypothetical protein VP01_4840g1 [Puccinia sorghi]
MVQWMVVNNTSHHTSLLLRLPPTLVPQNTHNHLLRMPQSKIKTCLGSLALDHQCTLTVQSVSQYIALKKPNATQPTGSHFVNSGRHFSILLLINNEPIQHLQQWHGPFTSSRARNSRKISHPQEQEIPEKSPLHLFDEASFGQFLNEIVSSKLTKGGVTIRMENPKKEIFQARKDLLAKTMKRISARSPVTTTLRLGCAMVASDVDSADNSSDVEFDDLDVHINEIYGKYRMNADYDHIHPSPVEYLFGFLILSIAYLANGDDDYCPCCLKIKFLSRSKAQKGKSKEGSQLPADTLFGLTKWLVAKNAGPSACQGSSPPSSVHGSSPDSLYGYLKFINISSHKCQAVYNTLISNNINSFRMFGSLTYEELQVLEL